MKDENLDKIINKLNRERKILLYKVNALAKYTVNESKKILKDKEEIKNE